MLLCNILAVKKHMNGLTQFSTILLYQVHTQLHETLDRYRSQNTMVIDICLTIG